MPFGIQPWHIIVILIVALIIFGPSRLPELGHSIGKAITEFRRGTREMTEGIKDEIAQAGDQGPLSPQSPLSPSITVSEAQPAMTDPHPSPSMMTTSSQPQPMLQVQPVDSRPAVGIKCPSCGSMNVATAHFCNNCGKQLAA